MIQFKIYQVYNIFDKYHFFSLNNLNYKNLIIKFNIYENEIKKEKFCRLYFINCFNYIFNF